jgi:hypothetical protein
MFLVVAAILLPTYAAPALVKVPLDQDSQSVAEAKGATVFRVATLSEENDVDLKAIRTVRGDVKDGDADRAVFDVFVYVKDSAGKEVTYNTDRVALDRRSAEAVTCCGENVNGTATKHKGLSYKFPFNTEKKTYQYFDTTARKSYPIRYTGTEKIKGVEVYVFRMTAEPVKIGELKLPGTLLGSSEQLATAERYYSNTRTIWVEPESGVIIKGREEQRQTFRNAEGQDKVTVIDANLEFNDKTVTEALKTADDANSIKALLSTTLPWIFGIVGALLVLAGLALVVTGRPTQARGGHRRARVGTAAPVA